MAWGKRSDPRDAVAASREHAPAGPVVQPEPERRAPAGETEVMSVVERTQPEEDWTVIGPGAMLDGLLVSGGPLRIEGEVKGEVRADGTVVVAAPAKVEAEIRAHGLRVEGRYTGNAEITARAELGPTAQMQGNLTCAALVVAEGAVFNGTTTMNAGAPVISISEATSSSDKG